MDDFLLRTLPLFYCVLCQAPQPDPCVFCPNPVPFLGGVAEPPLPPKICK
ncbi:hypothetical protein PPL_06771 [Heterostelium album PN500]|uniref:Uncharacterized protein n=1 Tax=Heterostelium pallidum (strain ATCC 26659 / Pp 5 / PN500) TaxID=670386 RepID=D3BFN6_HETP5|nr:hypothetical protein PPL_06771 [Heterostelium album PN500]EFA79950.1 hypothetical protein PPL_06771 [Heterostelium album PN500]|eukprot:XP_020432070.1 hypothetical protein PPL_06771 [Heterostelium album PN500]